MNKEQINPKWIETLEALQDPGLDKFQKFGWVSATPEEISKFNRLALLTIPGFFIDDEGDGMLHPVCVTNHNVTIVPFGPCIWLLKQ